MKFKWKESISIPDGNHQGEITKIVNRTDPYDYTDIFIKVDGFDVELKYGCPSILSENSKLGRLMQSFGQQFQKDVEIDIEEILKGKRVTFMTLTKKTKDKKEFSEIVSDSLKPLVETVKV